MWIRATIRFATLIGLLIFLNHPAVAQTSEFIGVWQQFRASHPYHIQIVGLSQAGNGGRRLLLISEPPPNVTIAGLKAVNPSAMEKLNTARYRIGYNGWTKDVLVDLPSMDDKSVGLLIDKLYSYLYGTSYKAVAVPIPYPESSSQAAYKLDLRVPSSTLSSWLLRDSSSNWWKWILLCALILLILVTRRRNWLWAAVAVCCGILIHSIVTVRAEMTFAPIEGGPALNVKSLLRGKTSGVFLSDTPGLVMWLFPRTEPLSRYRLEARQFCLDSDIILGAIASAGEIAVVARERSASPWSLPPLRVETVLLLASVRTDELAQSYERTNLVAGKFDETRNLDWAPIYLSPELIDTEYGSLLNITDQILKSWSEAGEVEYVNFKYPRPSTWPFPEPLDRFAKTRELTFNWNTKGAGYTVADGEFEVYALNRTGALPVDYLSLTNEQLKKAEDDGYEYFATRSDPNLVRVVQYAGLYQIFRQFHITSPAREYTNLPSPDVLKSSAMTVVADLERLNDAVVAGITENLEQAASLQPADQDLQAELDELKGLQELKESVTEFIDTWGEPGRTALVASIVSPRELSGISSEKLKLIQAASGDDSNKVFEQLKPSEQMALMAIVLSKQISQHHEILQFICHFDLASIMSRYVAEVERPGSNWIKTPTIVVSHPTGGSAETTGGHNLDASTSLFRASQNVDSGKIRVIEENGRKVVLYNSSDSEKLSEMVRTIGRDESDKNASEIERELQGVLDKSTQSRSVDFPDSLGFTTEVRPSAVRGLDPDLTPKAVETTGYRSGRQTSSDELAIVELLASTRSSGIVVDRDKSTGVFLIFHGGSRRVFEAQDVASAQDAVISCMRRAAEDGLPVRVHLRGLDPRQARGFIDSAELHLDDLKPTEVIATVDDAGLSSTELSDILRQNYDFEHATIGDIPTILNPSDRQIDIDITVPHKTQSKPPLLVRIRIFFEQGIQLTQDVFATLGNAVAQWARSLANVSDSIQMISSASSLARELRSIHPGIRLQIQLSRESKDLYIVHNQYFGSFDGNKSRSL